MDLASRTSEHHNKQTTTTNNNNNQLLFKLVSGIQCLMKLEGEKQEEEVKGA